MNDTHRIDYTLWVVMDGPLLSMFIDQESAWEFYLMHSDEGWNEPAEYEVGHYEKVSEQASRLAKETNA